MLARWRHDPMNESLLKCIRVPGKPAIAYSELGKGKPLVFLHGIGGNRSNWKEQQIHFASLGYRALAWDARGYGDSDDYEGGFSFSDVADDLRRLLDHIDAERAFFVGLSMGGRILMDFAHRFPGNVSALVICGAFPSFDKSLSASQRASFIDLRRRPLLEGRSFRELAPDLIASLLSPDAPDSVRQRVTESICLLRRDSYLKALEAAENFDRSEEIAEIRCPTLLVYAAEDRLAPPQLGEQVARQIPGAKLALIPGAGHLMNIEAPAAFNQTVGEFFAALGELNNSRIPIAVADGMQSSSP